MKASIIVTCKGRLHHLAATVPHLLTLRTGNFDYDVMVVDYGCPAKTFSYCCAMAQPRLRAVAAFDNVEYFNLARCRNLGAQASDADVFAFLDADLVPPADYLVRAMRVLEKDSDMVHYAVYGKAVGDGDGNWYTVSPIPRADEGRVPLVPPAVKSQTGEPIDRAIISRIAHRKVWERVRGFDEAFHGWGFEDTDFRLRAMDAGFTDWHLGGEFGFLNHGEEDSVVHYQEKDKAVSAQRNLSLLEKDDRVVNPDGYGVSARCLFWPPRKQAMLPEAVEVMPARA